ncbi:MAG: GNAT family N-acetyltransferase [Rickettsiaceae bacterium]|nr:GNAT family N-acetyltransferase [Rickettsiaceae bacterium]
MITNFFNYFPVLEIEDNIILRQITTSDAKDYFEYMNNENVAKFVSGTNLPQSIEHAIDELRYWGSLFSSRRSIYWGVVLKDINKLIGTAGFNSLWQTHSRAELSYDLNFDYWGLGIMHKSLSKILDFAETEMGVVRVQASTIISNTRSFKLLDKLGFQQEGIMRKYEYLHNQHQDALLLSKILI